MNNPFLKRLMKNDRKEDIFHSSTFGQAQSGATMGSASSSSFSERKTVDRERKIIKSYGDSQIMGGAFNSGPRAQKYVPPKGK